MWRSLSIERGRNVDTYAISQSTVLTTSTRPHLSHAPTGRKRIRIGSQVTLPSSEMGAKHPFVSAADVSRPSHLAGGSLEWTVCAQRRTVGSACRRRYDSAQQRILWLNRLAATWLQGQRVTFLNSCAWMLPDVLSMCHSMFKIHTSPLYVQSKPFG